MKKSKLLLLFFSLTIFLFTYLFVFQSKAYALSATITSSATTTSIGQPTLTFTLSGEGTHFKDMKVYVQTASATNPYPYWCPGTISQQWCLLGTVSASNNPYVSSLNGTVSWTPRNGGSYLVVVNASDYWGNFCSGVPGYSTSCSLSDDVAVSAINGPAFSINEVSCNIFDVTFSGGNANSNVHLGFVLPSSYNPDLGATYGLYDYDLTLDGNGYRRVQFWPHDGLSYDSKQKFFDGTHTRKLSIWASYGSSIAWDTSNAIGRDSGTIGPCNPSTSVPNSGSFSATCDKFSGTSGDPDWPNHSLMIDHWLEPQFNLNPTPAFTSVNTNYGTSTHDRVYLGPSCLTDEKDSNNNFIARGPGETRNGNTDTYMCSGLGDILQGSNRGYSFYPRLSFKDGPPFNPCMAYDNSTNPPTCTTYGSTETWNQYTDFFSGTSRKVSAFAIGIDVFGKRIGGSTRLATTNGLGYYNLSCYKNLTVSCSSSADTIKTTDTVNFSAAVSGGGGSYDYGLTEVDSNGNYVRGLNFDGEFYSAPTTLTKTGVTFSTKGTKTVKYGITSKSGVNDSTRTQSTSCTKTITVCASTYGQSCSPENNCGATNTGTYDCDGNCSVSAPANVPNIGNSCTLTSSANNCGAVNTATGSLACNAAGTGSYCNVTAPSAPADVANIGSSCTQTSSANSCGDTNSNSGTLQCNAAKTGSTCSAFVPSSPGERTNYNTVCTVYSAYNACGQRASATGINNVCLGGANSGQGVGCSASVPAVPSCTLPTTNSGLNITADTARGGVKAGIYQRNGLLSIEGGKNYYNTLKINPTFETETPNEDGTSNIALSGAVFIPSSLGSPGASADLATIKTKLGATSKGFLLIYANQNLVNSDGPTISDNTTIDGTSGCAGYNFCKDYFYVYFKGAWRKVITSVNGTYNGFSLGLSVALTTASFTSPEFSVTLYKSLGSTTFLTHSYLMYYTYDSNKVRTTNHSVSLKTPVDN